MLTNVSLAESGLVPHGKHISVMLPQSHKKRIPFSFTSFSVATHSWPYFLSLLTFTRFLVTLLLFYVHESFSNAVMNFIVGEDETSSPKDASPPSADDERLKRTKETQTDFS